MWPFKRRAQIEALWSINWSISWHCIIPTMCETCPTIFLSIQKKVQCYPLTVAILGIWSSTISLQSTPFQNPGGLRRLLQSSRSSSSDIRLTLHLSKTGFVSHFNCILSSSVYNNHAKAWKRKEISNFYEFLDMG